MRFGVLGPLAVWTEDGRPVTIPGAKVRALLADLLLHEGRAVSADRLIDDLWGADPPRNPAAALQVKVSQLRKALDDAEPGGRDLVVSGAAGYALHIPEDALDATAAATLVGRAATAPDPRTGAELLTEALALWRGGALADLADEQFARAGIARLEEQRLTALEDRAEARLETGDHGSPAGELSGLVARHPLRERLRAAHMLTLYRSGRQSEALATFGELRDRLRDELGLDPGPEVTALHEAILRQDPDLDGARPEQPRFRTNLPSAFSELVGRDEALRTVGELVAAVRLVTLTGPGGVGKTRLALETAAGVAAGERLGTGEQLAPGERPAAHLDGVWLVELAGIESATHTIDRVARAVAAALDIRDDAAPTLPRDGRPAQASAWLAEALRERTALLVLDNCEHLIDAVARLSEILLRAAPGLRILATSQEPLGLAGEAVWVVPPLERPYSPAETESRPAGLRRFSAVRLFEARVAAAVPGFELTAGNSRAVAAICRRLDGIPLALELAATRVRALGVHELAERLDDRFHVLAVGHRGGPARQQTLRAMIDWSWELLTGPEQAVLRRLAVHADGCTLEAAEEVSGEDDVLGVLARLVDRSMVVMTEGQAGVRYRLLESVSAYALERLGDAGEAAQVRLRCAHYYTDLAERAEQRLRGPEQRRWLQRLDAEHANLRTALDEAIRTDHPDLAVRLVNALAWYWFLRGRIGEAQHSLERVLALAEDPVARAWLIGIRLLGSRGCGPAEPTRSVPGAFDTIDDPDARARAEWFLSEVLLGAGDVSTSRRLVERALPAFRTSGDRWGEAVALATTANLALLRGEIETFRDTAAESREIIAELGERWGQVRATELLARHAEITGDHFRAAGLLGDGQRLAEELGLWLQVSLLISGQGRLALLAGDYDESVRLHERGRAMAAEHGYRPGEMFALTGLALADRRAGRLDAAEAYMRTALEWEREVDYLPGITLALAELGFVAELRGDAAKARALHEEGLAAAAENGDPRAIALALEGLAGAEALAGRPAEAARLLDEASALRASAGAPLPPAERGDVDRIARTMERSAGD